MNRCFTFNYPDEPFRLFSTSHIIALWLVLTACILVAAGRKRLGEAQLNKSFRYSLGLIMIVQEVLAQVWLVSAGEWSVKYSLPLHLCGVSIILAAVMLFKKSYPIFEVTYFWGLGGTVQALLTPDLGPFSFPHLFFYQFFISHGLIVVACIYMTFVEGCRPTPGSILKTVILTNIYAVFVAGFNLITGGNYLYICEKPGNPSLLDFLGPWPWYLMSLEFVLVLMCCLCYLPFVVHSRLAGRHKAGQMGA